MKCRVPIWLTAPVSIILAGSFLSSMSAFLVAPYLMVFLTRDAHVAVGLAGTFIGLQYWLLRAGGLIADPFVRRYGHRAVMLWGGGLRIPGYLLMALQTVPTIAVGLCLVGLGGGLYFPPSKSFLIRLLPKEYQLTGLSVRNVTANVGVAIGPLIGTLGAQYFGLRGVVVSAALCFTALAILVRFLPSLAELSEVSAKKEAGGGERPIAAVSGEDSPASSGWRSFLTLLPKERIVFALIPLSLLLGAFLTQMDTLLPEVLAYHSLDSWLGVAFTVNAICAVALQPIGLAAVRRSFLLVGLLASLGSVGLFLSLIPQFISVGSIILAVFSLTLVEVVASMAIDDAIRVLPQKRVTLAYGVQGLCDGIGGLFGSPAIVALYAAADMAGKSLVLSAFAGICALAFAVSVGIIRPGLRS